MNKKNNNAINILDIIIFSLFYIFILSIIYDLLCIVLHT